MSVHSIRIPNTFMEGRNSFFNKVMYFSPFIVEIIIIEAAFTNPDITEAELHW